MRVARRQRKRAPRSRSSAIQLGFSCWHLTGARWLSNSARQHESRGDQPDKARKSHERNEEKCLREDQVEPTQLTGNRQQKAECHNPRGQQLPQSGGDAYSRPQQTHGDGKNGTAQNRSEEHTSELQSHLNLVCRLLL